MTRPTATRCRDRLKSCFRSARLRTQLLLVINLALALVVGLMMTADLWFSYESRLVQKQIALSEEARTVMSAIVSLQAMGGDNIQEYVDRTCAFMNDEESPGHSIHVALGGEQFVANATVHSGHKSVAEEQIFGIFELDGVRVSIGEDVAPVRSAALITGAGRLAAILFTGMLAGILLSVLLVLLVARPLERLAAAVREIGHGTFGIAMHAGPNAELSGLAREITAMSHELDRREKGRQQQLSRARRLQAHLIGSSQSVDGLEFYIEHHPADEIAGDFVDVITCSNGDTLVCLADVVGHGVHAAMEASVLKALLLSVAIDEASPAAILQTLNRMFYSTSLPEDFASMVIVRISRDRRRVTFANAGHEPGYVRSISGEWQMIYSTGMLLGVSEETNYDLGAIELSSGDVIVLLSDGLPEARNAQGEWLGRTAIQSALRSAIPGDALTVALAALGAARAHRGAIPADDDETVVAVALSQVPSDDETGKPSVKHPEMAGAADDTEDALSSTSQERSDASVQ